MKTWNTKDKSTWQPGPWTNEPDKAQWIAHGLDCLIVRNQSGALCGYAGVPEKHPLFGVGYSEESPALAKALEARMNSPVDEKQLGLGVMLGLMLGEGEKQTPEMAFSVHGGLTFAAKCRPSDDPAHGICHTGEDVANKVVWWFGFDCAHAGDVSPAYERHFGYSEVYRDFDYVKQQTENLAKQLSEIA